ncbi:MAG: rhodanese-like domain-containing protein [Gammaproteobacteria bacterium]
MAGLLSRLFGGGERALTTIDAATLAAWLASRDDVCVVDVRNADEFVGPLGHIAGALNLPLPALAARRAELEAPGDRTLVLVCLTDKRSGQACRELVAAGLPRVVLLGGGMRGWHAAGLPVADAHG